MARQHKMSGKSTNGNRYTWVSGASPDFAGASFPGPGSFVAGSAYVQSLYDDGTGIPGPVGPAGSDLTREPIRVAAVTNIALTGTYTLQGVALVNGDRVGAFGQTDGTKGGVYVVAAGAWTRAADFDSSGECVAGMGGLIKEGTYNGGSWTLLTEGATLGTDPISFKVEPFLDVTGQDGKAVTVASGVPSLTKIGDSHVADNTLSPGKIASGGTGNNGKVVGVAAGVTTLIDPPGARLQDGQGTALPAQAYTQFKGAAALKDPTNGRNTIDYDREDIRTWGANMGGVQRTTATGTAGNAAITLANAKNYIDGNWLMLSGMGAAHGMAAPSAPTLAVQGTTGARTIAVKVVALTSTGGYTAASSATTVTTANATLSISNFLEVWFAPVPGAYRYLVYVQFDGAGSFTYYGGAVAWAQFDDLGRTEPQTFRIVSNTPPTAPAWLPSTAPAAALTNGLRTKIISGGGTTTITVSPVPITSQTGANCDACNVIPFEDAIRADGTGYSTEVRIPLGTAYCTTQLQIRSPARFTGANGGGSGQAGSIVMFRDGCGPAAYNTLLADQWQPGTQYRLGDRVVSQTRTGSTGCWTLTAIAAGAAWATSGTAEPTWDYTSLSTTTDNGHTWTFKQVSYTAAGWKYGHLSWHCEGSTIPAHRYAVEDDLRVGARYLAGLGNTPQAWQANTVIPLNAYRVPTDPNLTGKMYQATAGGTTHATTEPTWPKVIGATVVDNGVTWTCVDVRRRQGGGLLVATVTNGHDFQIKGFHGTGLLCTGSTSGDGSAINRSTFSNFDIRNCTGHHIAIYGQDASNCSFKDGTLGVRTTTTGGACAVQDNSLYGNKYENLLHDGGARYQNKPWTNSVQIECLFDNCYVEGVSGSDTDINMPGEVRHGHHAMGFRTGCTGLRTSVAASVANISQAVNSARLEFDDTGTELLSRQLTGGAERKLWGSGTVAAGTLLQEQHESLLTTKGRSRKTVFGTTSVEETAHYDARGPGVVFPADMRVGSAFNTESRFASAVAVPTTGVHNAGDWNTWCLDNRRLAIKPARAGGLGATARANSTAYARGDVISTSSKHFVCVVPGTSAGSLPGGYAGATIGTYVQDGTALFQMWTTAQDPNLTAIPNLWADPIAVTDVDQTIQHFLSNDGQPCRDMPAATANRIITLGTTGMIAGDCYMLRQLNSVAFTITINTVDGGSVVMPASTKCWVVIKMTRAGTFTQHSAGILL